MYCSTKAAVSLLTEDLHDELKPFSIDVCILEPGYFRTGFLNPGACIKVEQSVEAYADSAAGQVRKMLETVDNNQPGDPIKGARVVVDVLTKFGAAEGREIPQRLALGTACLAVIREKCQGTMALLDEWESISTSIDF